MKNKARMLTKSLLIAALVSPLIVQLGVHVSASASDALQLLALIKINPLDSAQQRCDAYEKALRANEPEQANLKRDDLIRNALRSVADRNPESLSADDRRVLDELRKCAHPAETLKLTEWELSKLVEVEKSAKSLEERCHQFDKHLRKFHSVWDVGLSIASSADLFQRAINDLSSRYNPLGDKQPVLDLLRECANKLPPYKTHAHGAAPDERPPAPSEAPSLSDSDLAALEEANTSAQSLPLDQRCRALDEQLRQLLFESRPRLATASSATVFERVIDFLPTRWLPFPQQAHNQPVLIALKECVSKLAFYQVPEGRAGGAISETPRENSEDQSIASSPSPAIEQVGGQRTLSEDECADRIEKQLLEARHSADTREAQLVKQLEDQALKLDQLQHQLALVSQQLGYVERVRANFYAQHHHQHQNGAVDESGAVRSGVDDSIGADQATKEKQEEVYDDPIDIARKLGYRMRAWERLESRCQKYFMALNHPGKVTEKFIKFLAKLRLPVTTNQDPEYYNLLERFVKVLVQSGDKQNQTVLREIRQCLAAFANNNPASSSAQQNPSPQQQQQQYQQNWNQGRQQQQQFANSQPGEQDWSRYNGVAQGQVYLPYPAAYN